ncbi:sex peptide receptor-related protein 2-like [Haliotis asinina]|uniref:sex peptide receptor-related protein 2-like n=1 Tax=Haliotis asinina TaxID=109174 RepID=UPI003531DD8A
MELTLFYTLVVVLSSTAQESTVTLPSTFAVATDVPRPKITNATSPIVQSTSVLRDVTDVTTEGAYNVTDMGPNDIIINSNNNTIHGNSNITVENEEEDKSASPFALIHSGSVTEATYKTFLTVTGYIQLPLTVIALATNICNVVVFCQKRMKSPTSTILLALCISEVLFLTTDITASIMDLIYGDKALTERIYLFYGLYVSNYASVTLRRVGFCYTCLVSAERFIAVTFPLQAKSMRLVKNPGVVCALIMVAGFLAHIFSPVKYVVTSYKTDDNTTAYRFEHTSMYVRDKVHFENASMASKFIFVYLMLLGCLFFNLLIVISLRRHSKGRQAIKTSQNSDQAQKREMQTTITIMASTMVYVILALPTNTNSIINNISDDYGIFTREHFLFFLVGRVGNVCELVSNFTNFFFYIMLSATFRETFRQMFIPCASPDKSARIIVQRSSSGDTGNTFQVSVD